MLFVGDKSVVKDGVAALTRLKNGLSMRFDTRLEPGDAVTVWWVIFDDPAKCSDGACGSDDERSMIRADGHVVDSTGSALFKASLAVGDVSEATRGTGLKDPMAAEIHLVIRTHGPAVPGKIDPMIYELEGGCGGDPDPCANIQFAVFKPPAN